MPPTIFEGGKDMPDKTIKHFVFIRFFPYKLSSFKRDIFDTDFLSAQVSLAKSNLLKSLENQTNKDFEVGFWTNDKYLSNPKYEFIFTELQNGITLPLKFLKKDDMSHLVSVAYDSYDFVIQSRVDFDDFMYKDAVADTQSKIDECKDILSYGYCKGYTYFNGELYTFPIPAYAHRGQMSTFQSWILKSSFAKQIPFIGSYSFNHTKVKPSLKEFLENNGLEFRDDMYQANVSDNAFIYFRHDATWMNNGKPYTEKPKSIDIKKKLTAKDITKKQLEEEFGFTGYELKSIK